MMLSTDNLTENLLPSMSSEKQQRSSNFRKVRIITVLAVTVLAGICWTSLSTSSSSTSSSSSSTSTLSTPSTKQAINNFWKGKVPSHSFELPHTYTGSYPSNSLNSTLGFEKIYVLSLPHRADKRDELAIMSYASDLDLEFVDGVSAKDLDNMIIADYPETMHRGILGCYRSHVNALRKVVEDRVETAIIMEDDIDWDVDVRKSLEALQDPWTTLIGSMKQDNLERGGTNASPFGDSRDWDLIYLGACLEKPWIADAEGRNVTLIGDKLVDYDHPPYVLYDDDTAPDYTQTTANVREVLGDYKIDILGGPESTETRRRRIVQRANGPICTTSYAVTRRGAARMLYALTRGINSPVDLLMNWAVGGGSVEGYTVFPPIFDQWKIEGGKANSDINFKPKDASHLQARATPDVGKSWNIRNSIRKNLTKIIPAAHV